MRQTIAAAAMLAMSLAVIEARADDAAMKGTLDAERRYSYVHDLHTTEAHKLQEVCMALPLFQLLQPENTIDVPGEIAGEGWHEKVADAYQWQIEIPDGFVILTIWQGKLHEVIYQTPAKDENAAAERNAALFDHYGDGHPFNEILDNGFGKTYRRADMQRYALWSYVMDFTTVGTMDFHAFEWG